MSRNQHPVRPAADQRHTARTTIPNQSTDTVMACDSASVSAPDGEPPTNAVGITFDSRSTHRNRRIRATSGWRQHEDDLGSQGAAE